MASTRIAPAAPSGTQRPASRARARFLFLTGAAVAIAAMLAFHGLDNHPFWEDEASTALFARNLLRFGELTAWDGRNLIGSEQGRELDENLVNVKFPPLQFYLAAAGLAVFGDTTFGARAPFVLVGILTLPVVAWWARRFLGAGFPCWLPALLLAVSPAFLLFIRNCRYFSPGIFWTAALFAAWAGAGTGPAARRPWFYPLAGATAAAGLFATHPLYAAAALGVLPALFLHAAYRTRNHAALCVAVFAVGLFCGLFLASRGQGGGSFFTRAGSVSWLENASTLFWWHLRDAGRFEFIAWPVLLPLALPWIVPRLASSRPLARRGLVLAVAVFVYSAGLSILSQQPVDNTFEAAARYFAPVLVLAALLSAIALVLLHRIHAALGIAAATVFLGSTVLYLAPAYELSGGGGRHRFLLRPRLYDYISENARPYQSAYAALLAWARPIPAGTKILMNPTLASYPLMFYRPDLVFCGLLEGDKDIRPDLRVQLPDAVFEGMSRPDIWIFHPGEAPMLQPRDRMKLVRPGLGDEVLEFELKGRVLTHWRDTVRPEIPAHLFRAPTEASRHPGFVVYGRIDPPDRESPAPPAPPAMPELPAATPPRPDVP